MILLLGAAGSGMRNLAYLLLERGETVAGTDAAPALPKYLIARGLRALAQREAGAMMARADRIIYSDALAADDRLLTSARRSRATVQSYSEAVAWLASRRTLVAVAGTHGKSSTTAMLGHILADSGFDPTVLVGAPVTGWPGGGARLGRGDMFVVEADEYRDHYLAWRPGHAAITSLDWDHPDYFASLAAVERSFAAFLNRIHAGGTVVTLPAVQAAHARLPWPAGCVLAPALPKHMQVPIPGAHMRDNAAVAIALAKALGVQQSAAANALSSFPGVGRRFEILGTLRGLTIISDYGHHPAAIGATLAAAREQYPSQRIAVLLEVHTLERLKKFRREFTEALLAADGVLLLPVFAPPGRELAGRADRALQNFRRDLAAKGIRTEHVASFAQLPSRLRSLIGQFDIALAFSAGKLDQYLRMAVKQ